MPFESGGQGLWSTVDDYLAFARIFLGGGEVDGVPLLRPETCAMMTANQLTSDQRRTARMFGMPPFAAGHGYGMGVAVVMEPDKADPLRCRGGVGTVGWPGAYGGWWQADPNDNSVLIFLAHNMLELQQMASGIGLARVECHSEVSRTRVRLTTAHESSRLGPRPAAMARAAIVDGGRPTTRRPSRGSRRGCRRGSRR